LASGYLGDVVMNNLHPTASPADGLEIANISLHELDIARSVRGVDQIENATGRLAAQVLQQERTKVTGPARYQGLCHAFTSDALDGLQLRRTKIKCNNVKVGSQSVGCGVSAIYLTSITVVPADW
jgi:hypothetical protein